MSKCPRQREMRGRRLDVMDMERHIVDFRVFLDRAMRRCLAANMIDVFKKLLEDKLNELDSMRRPANALSIEIQGVETEDFRRLENFLRCIIDLCSLRDHFIKYENVLRDVLKDNRCKSVSVLLPSSLELVCLFCASNLVGRHQGIEHVAAYNGSDMYTPTMTAEPTAGDPTAGDPTPPPSAAPTPEVGEQARQKQQEPPSDRPTVPPARIQHRDNIIQEEQPSLDDFQPQFQQSFTSSLAPQATYTPDISSVRNLNRLSVLNGRDLAHSTTPPMSPVPVSNSQQVNSTTSQPVSQQAPAQDNTNTNASKQQEQLQKQQQPQQQQQQQQQQPQKRPQPQQPQQPEPQPGPSGLGRTVVQPSDISGSDSDSDSDSEPRDEVRNICTNILDKYQLRNDGGGLRSSTPLTSRFDRVDQSQGKLVIDECAPTPPKRRPKTKLGANHSLGGSRVSTNGTKPVPVEVPPPVVEDDAASQAASASTNPTEDEQDMGTSDRFRRSNLRKKHQPKRGLASKRF